MFLLRMKTILLKKRKKQTDICFALVNEIADLRFKHNRFKSAKMYFEYFENTKYLEIPPQNTLLKYLRFSGLKYKIQNTNVF